MKKSQNETDCPACGSYNKSSNEIEINKKKFTCNCKEQKKLLKTYTQSNIPNEYWYLNLDDYAGDKNACKEIKDYIDHLDGYYRQGIGLFLYGSNGTGKTLLGTEILKAAKQEKYTIFFVSYSQIISMLTDSWYDNTAKKNFEKNIRQSDFLLIDDIGKAYHSQGGLAESAFENALRYRSGPTIITSNHNVEQLRRLYAGTWGASISSLTYGKLRQIPVYGNDFRKDISPRLKAIAEQAKYYNPLK